MKQTKLVALLLIISTSVSLTACAGHSEAKTSLQSSSSISSSADSVSAIGSENSSANTSSSNGSTYVDSSGNTVNIPKSQAGNPTSTPSGKSAIQTSTSKAGTNGASKPAGSSKPASNKPASTNTGTGSKPATTTTPGTKPSSPSTTPSTKPAPSTSPKPKTAYDRPFDIAQIKADMIAYGKSRGMFLKTSLYVQNVPPDYPSNAGYKFPLDTRTDVSNSSQFKQFCKDDIDLLITQLQYVDPGIKPSDIGFNVVILPLFNSPGDYLIFIPYG